MILSFFFAFIQRVMSGAASLFGYKKNFFGLHVVSLAMILLPIWTAEHNWLFWLFMVVNAICVVMKVVSFDDEIKGWTAKYKDIHLWENLVTGGFGLFLALTGHNLLMLVLAVYPALILHKGLINIGSGLSFFAEATDDATGKTYGIPLLGIKVKRSSTKFRLIVAGLSLIGAVLVYLLNIQVALYLF